MNEGEMKNPEEASAEVNALVAQAVEAMHKVVEELSGMLAGKAAVLGETAAGARDVGRARLDDLTDAVRKNPLAWLAAAAGVGLVVGLWRNRDSRS